jgi:hypothetical protein
MTKDEILNMPAGTKMDDLIAELVMHDPMGQVWSRHYSTDISAAWEVVEKMQGDFWKLEFIGGSYRARFINSKLHQWELTAPLAICRAALLTVLEETK